MASPTSCTLVLPCRDEAASLRRLLPRVPEDLEVVVVDNGSVDGTAEVARRHGARVVAEPTPGYGAAVQAGVEAADTEYVAVMDGDGSVRPDVLERLTAAVRCGQADLACGRRVPVRRGVWPWHARWGNALVLRWVRRTTGLDLQDMATVRVCRRQALLDLDVRDRRFGYPLELLVKAHRAGWALVEVDVPYHPRTAGTRSKVSGSLRGTVRTARDFVQVLT